MSRPVTLKELATSCEGELSCSDDQVLVARILVDSRLAFRPENSLFVALKGAKVDGTVFIPELIKKGVKNFLVPASYQPDPGSAAFIFVKDTRIALQKIAEFLRSEFTQPVLGITGSNGKTIVKEWLGQLLSLHYSVAKSPKSYNSQVGVPLSIFEIQPFHQVAILEAGISKTGEMSALKQMIRPDIGLFTTIGSAHDAGFADRESKLREKLLLFTASKLLIYCQDQEMVHQIVQEMYPADRLISWSDHPGADYTRSIQEKNGKTRILLVKKDLSTYTFYTHIRDRASLENLTHTLLAAMTLGLSPKKIQQGVDQLRPVDMRLTLKDGLRGCLLIDDTYNHDVGGLRVALEFMQQQRPKRRKILILSDFLQQGKPSWIYPEVAQLILDYSLDLVLGVGKEITHLQQLGVQNFQGFPTTESLQKQLHTMDLADDLLLITGARVFGFERIIQQLQQRIHGTTLEINLNALTHNFNFYKRLIHPQTKVMVMVKAFAYGGGAPEIANHLQTLGADYLAVAFTDEGVALREKGIQLPIMVLNPLEASLGHCLAYQLEPVVFSPEFFQTVASWTAEKRATLKIHLDLDTGMHRLGFEKTHLEVLKKLIRQHPQLQIASLYTHLAAADETEEDSYTRSQLRAFEEMTADLLPEIKGTPLLHALNSAGIVSYPQHQYDLVRLGIGLYGVDVTGNHASELLPVSQLKTSISQVKELEAGCTIGYSRKGLLPRGGKIATLPIGYADGYDRRFSNGVGHVLIHGKKAPVIGNVCMDMVMVDVSDLDVSVGDEVLIYGADIPLAPLAKKIGTIPYELLTHISSRVKRVYYLD